MPVTNDFFYVEPEGSVYRNDSIADIRPSEDIHRESLIMTVSRVHKKFRISSTYPGKVRSLGSTIAHICYTATGSADASLVSDCNIWDLAAGLAMLYRNGGSAYYVNGDEFSIDDDLLAGNKLQMPVLLGRHNAVQYFLETIAYEP